jgi:hypothetical protein
VIEEPKKSKVIEEPKKSSGLFFGLL